MELQPLPLHRYSGDDYCNAMALQSDGKIVLAGQAINRQRFSDIAVVRDNADERRTTVSA